MNTAARTPAVRDSSASYMTSEYSHLGMDFWIEVDSERYQDGQKMGTIWIAKIYGPDGGLFRETLGTSAMGALSGAVDLIVRFF